jgi:hypothetical protein
MRHRPSIERWFHADAFPHLLFTDAVVTGSNRHRSGGSRLDGLVAVGGAATPVANTGGLPPLDRHAWLVAAGPDVGEYGP